MRKMKIPVEPPQDHGRKGVPAIDKSITDIEDDFIQLCKMRMAVEEGRRYTPDISFSRIWIGSADTPERKTEALYPRISVKLGNKSWNSQVLNDKVQSYTPRDYHWNVAFGSGSVQIVVKARNSITAEQISSKLCFFFASMKQGIRNKFLIDLRDINQSAPRAVKPEGGTSVYAVVISASFMVEYNWTSTTHAEELARILYEYEVEGSSVLKRDVLSTAAILAQDIEN